MLLWSAAGLLQMETKTINTAELLHHTLSLPAVSYSETNTQRQKAQYSSMVKKTIFFVCVTLFCYNVMLPLLPIPKTVSELSSMLQEEMPQDF